MIEVFDVEHDCTHAIKIEDILGIYPHHYMNTITHMYASSLIETKKGDIKAAAYPCEVLSEIGKVQLTEDEAVYLGDFQFVPVKEQTIIKEDRVNHPSHYTWLKEKCGIEVIDITKHLDFCLGNAIKYILRAGHKNEVGISKKEKTTEDLRKAIFYINEEIKLIENE